MPVVALFFRTIHAFVIVHHASRRIVHVGVTAHPTDAWLTQPVREAPPKASLPEVRKAGAVVVFPVLNGLHHDYRRVAA